MQHSKIFEVRFSVPPTGDRKWKENRNAFVATGGDAESAIKLLKETEPDAEVWQCVHRTMNGKLIISPDVLEKA